MRREEQKRIITIFGPMIILVLVFLFLNFPSRSSVSVLGQSQSAFTDIESSWASEQILYLVNTGIISGYPDGTFRPQNPMTRAEFTRLIVSAFSSPSESPAAFLDLSYEHWVSLYVSRAQVQGWVNGFPDGTFHPQDPVTRAQVLAVLARIEAWPLSSWHYSSAPSSWASSYLAAALELKIVRENDPYFDFNGSFADQPASRQEVAAYLARSLQLDAGAGLSTASSVSPLTDREELLFHLVNSERQRNGLDALSWDQHLVEFAHAYAREMGVNGFFSHDSPLSGNFPTRAQVLFQDGYLLAGENLGRVQNSTAFTLEQLVSSLHAGFMNSATHRENILRGEWTSVGLGFYEKGDVFLVVEVFAQK